MFYHTKVDPKLPQFSSLPHKVFSERVPTPDA